MVLSKEGPDACMRIASVSMKLALCSVESEGHHSDVKGWPKRKKFTFIPSNVDISPELNIVFRGNPSA